MTDQENTEFLDCAWVAYIRLATQHGSPPDSESVRILAYDLYEQIIRQRSE